MTFTDEIAILLMGWAVGLIIAMPVGPVAVLTVKRTLHSGWPVGVATGMGAATADVIYAAMAAFGIYAVQDFLIKYQYSLRMIGGVILLGVGAMMLWQKTTIPQPNPKADAPLPEPIDDNIHRMTRGFATGLVLTLTNPLTLMAFLAVLANFGLSEEMSSYKTALVFVGGALAGATTWWLSLVGAVSLIKTRLSETLVAKINSVLAVILVMAGAIAIITGYFEKPLGKMLH